MNQNSIHRNNFFDHVNIIFTVRYSKQFANQKSFINGFYNLHNVEYLDTGTLQFFHEDLLAACMYQMTWHIYVNYFKIRGMNEEGV